MAVRSILIDRFHRLPRRSTDVWQGGVVRARTWIEGPDGRVTRPWAAAWVSHATGMMNVQLAEHDPPEPELALQTLIDLGLKFTKSRPSGIEVADAALGQRVAEALGDPELTVSVRSDLPDVAEVMRRMEEGTSQRPALPEAMEAPGVTVERMRAFAEAARDFYAAAPWRHLSDADLIDVEAPAVAPGLRHLAVLGAAHETFGLGFYANRREFDAVWEAPEAEPVLGKTGKWTVLYGPIDEMPFGDADLWENQHLPVASPSAYPMAFWFGPGNQLRRPRAKDLAEITAILMALARTSEAEIDGGRWTREVLGPDGAITMTLAIPELLEPLDAPPPRSGPMDRRAMERVTAEIQRFTQGSSLESLDEINAALRERFTGPIEALPSTATTPLEQAQDLMYRAYDARGRRRVQIARKALELSPDCADAYVVLAEESFEPETACAMYEQAVAAGERALGPAVFQQEAGGFWGLVTTRPYMRARFGLASSLRDLGRMDEAIEHYRELLRLNPSDNQGVRYMLLTALLEEERDVDAVALLRLFDDDPSAVWVYGRALAVFRIGGDVPAARECLQAAHRINRHVPQYLTGEAEWPGPEPSEYVAGSREEAVICASDLGEAWRSTPKAIDWLRAQAPAPRGKKRRRR